MTDVNGDGLPDVAGVGDAGVRVGLSTGNEVSEPSLWVKQFGLNTNAGAWRIEKHPRFMTDVNGDGLADVVGFRNNGVNVGLAKDSCRDNRKTLLIMLTAGNSGDENSVSMKVMTEN